MTLTRIFGFWVPRQWVRSATMALLAVLTVGLLSALRPLGPDGLVAFGLISVGFAGMIMDELLEFADATSVAASAGTALIGDVIPLSVARDIGNGRPVYLVITTDTEIITGGSAGTVQFLLASDATASIATDGSATVHFATKEFVTDDAGANDAQLNAGRVIAIVALPLEGPEYEAFLGILCVTATTTTTAGKINAFLTLDPSKWQAQADAL